MANSPRLIRLGYRLTDHAALVPDPNEMQIEYSVDSWTQPPEGYVLFLAGDDKEYFIPKDDIMKPLAPRKDEVPAAPTQTIEKDER